MGLMVQGQLSGMLWMVRGILTVGDGKGDQKGVQNVMVWAVVATMRWT